MKLKIEELLKMATTDAERIEIGKMMSNITYNKNQVKYMNEIVKNSENTIAKDIIDDLIFERYSRNVDRINNEYEIFFRK